MTIVPNNSKRQEAALRIVDETRWKLFPCWGVTGGRCDCGNDCKQGGKHPRGDLAPQGVKNATRDRAQIAAWWETYPNANLAVATGKPSGVWSLDLDRKNGDDGVGQLAELDPSGFGYDGFEETPKQTTGSGGRQVFFQMPATGDIRNQTGVGGKRIDVRGTGGYCIIAPSMNENGSYQWDLSPFDVEPAFADQWVVNFISNAGEKAESSLSFQYDGDLATHPGAAEGERNATLCRLVGQHLAAHGIDNDLLPLSQQWGSRCRPPFDPKEVQKTVNALAVKHAETNPNAATGVSKAAVFPLSSVEAKTVEWLWPGRLPRKLCIVSGNAGDGKTFALIDIAARVSTGTDFPDGESCQVGTVLFATVEDGIADTIRPRAESAGADLDRFLIFDGITRPDGETDLFLLDRHLVILDQLLRENPDIALLVIDPIGAFFGDVDSHKDAEIRRVLAPLSRLAETHNICIVGIAHMSKNSQRAAVLRTLGSVGIVAAARSAWGVVRDPDDRARRLFLPIKNNLADPDGLAYTIEEGLVCWDKTPVKVSIDDVGTMPQMQSACDEAMDWLKGKLADGPVAATEIIKACRADALSTRTLERAKKTLGVRSRRDAGIWKWYPPTPIVIGDTVVSDDGETILKF